MVMPCDRENQGSDRGSEVCSFCKPSVSVTASYYFLSSESITL